MLPDLDGFEVCRRLRTEGDRTPVLFLTARDATEDKVRGLTLGGDDYLVKPFSLEELVARIDAVLRRAGRPTPGRRGAARAPTSRWTTTPTACSRAGARCSLSPTEYNLLRYLLVNQGRVAVEGADPRPRLAVRLRRRRRRRRDLHRLPAPQGSTPSSPASSTPSAASGYTLREPAELARCRSGPACCSGMARRRGRARRRGASVDRPRPPRPTSSTRSTTSCAAVAVRRASPGPRAAARRPASRGGRRRLSPLYVGVVDATATRRDPSSRPTSTGDDAPLPDHRPPPRRERRRGGPRAVHRRQRRRRTSLPGAGASSERRAGAWSCCRPAARRRRRRGRPARRRRGGRRGRPCSPSSAS